MRGRNRVQGNDVRDVLHNKVVIILQERRLDVF